MSLKMKRFMAFVVGFSLVFAASVSQVMGAPETKIFNEVAEYVLRNTEVGGSIVNRLAGLKALQVTEESYSSFVARLKWKRNLGLRTEIQGELGKIETQLEKYRMDRGRPAKLEEGKPLPSDEQKFLDENAGSLKQNRIDELLLIEDKSLVKAYLGPANSIEGSGSYHANEAEFTAAGATVGDDGVVPARVEAEALSFDPNKGADLRGLQLKWWNKMFIRMNARTRFAKALLLGEGDWRNIFIRSGKPFTIDDLATVRKYNRLLDGINDYSHLRLMVRAFANEPSAVYTRLTEITADATAEFAKGFISIDSYIAAIKAAGSSAKLPLNDIVYETQRRILTVIERCNALGGKLNGVELGEGEVARAERGVFEMEDHLRKVEAQIDIDLEAGDKFALRRHRADRDLTRQRLDLAARVLEDKSFEFVNNRDLIEIFGNLRNGKINWESVQRFDMADPFFVDQARIDAWAPLYERSLARAINRQVKHEVSLAIKAQIGGTRKAVRSLNKLTEQVTGRLFTDSTTGKGLQAYAKHQLAANLIRLGKLMGVTIPVAVADEISGHQVAKFLKSLFTDDDGSGAPRSGMITSPFTPSTPLNPGVPVIRPTVLPGGSGTGLPPIGTPSARPAAGSGSSGGGGDGTPPIMRPRVNPNPNPNPIFTPGL
jgi:hypothetical protein